MFEVTSNALKKIKLKTKVKSVSIEVLILLALVIVGIFLRTYHFSDWLYFYPDQARDVKIVDEYLAGKSALPLLGFKAASTKFQLGAIYSYFQIISAKIFGTTPATVAYPDVFFGILSIPLVYFFVKKYFDLRISIALTALYSVSFYAIRYSRFAWNTNPIPFFSILFLIAILELVDSKDKTDWKWILALGIALGVGVQLHTVLLILLPATLVVAFLYLYGSNKKLWKIWVSVFSIALMLNVGQLKSEFNNNFENTKEFFNVLGDRSVDQDGGIIENFALNIICQSQANILYLSSIENNDDCVSFSRFKYQYNDYAYLKTIIIYAAGLFLLIAAYWLIILNFKKEQDKKKKAFLFFSAIYGIFAFLIILPIVGHNGQVRYWLPVIFLPFLFLGMVSNFILDKLPRMGKYILIGLLFILIWLNFSKVRYEASQFIHKNRSNEQYVVLGELEDIGNYIKTQSSPEKEAYIFGGQKHMQNFFNPLSYIENKNNFSIIRGGRHPEEIPKGKQIFFIGDNPNKDASVVNFATPADIGLKYDYYKSFGNIYIYKISN